VALSSRDTKLLSQIELKGLAAMPALFLLPIGIGGVASSGDSPARFVTTDGFPPLAGLFATDRNHFDLAT
jgi:hypothetical protein